MNVYWCIRIALFVAATHQRKMLIVEITEKHDCAHYTSCVECVQDPCSRTGRNPVSTRCAYCASKNLCMPLSSAASQCLREDTRIDFCSTETKLSSTQEITCQVNSTFVYIDLSYSSTIMWAHPSGTVTVGVALCRNAMPKFGSHHCLSQSPIVLYDAPLTSDSQCWNIGNVSNTMIRLLNDSNPSQGIEISYGTTHCCPQNGQAYPGSLGFLGVVVTLIPDACDKPYNDAWSIDNIQYPRQPLVNCSAVPSDSYSIVIRTSRLCPQRILWKVSSTKSQLFCSISGSSVSCIVTPRLSFNGTVDYSLCMRFSLRLIAAENVFKAMALKNFTKNRTPCTFLIHLDKTIQRLEVYDVDGTVVGKPFEIVRSADHSLSLELTIGAATGGGLSVIVAVVLSVLFCRRHTSFNKEKTPLLYDSSGRINESIQDLQRKPTNNGVQCDVKVQENDQDSK